MIMFATGHRPDKLLGYGLPAQRKLAIFAGEVLQRERPTLIISGMALGWDMAVAAAALFTGIPYIAAVPFEGQESKWPEEAQANYRFLRSFAIRVVHVCTPGYAAWKMQTRNEWMVDNGEWGLALWDGSPGGTANCVRYANNSNKPVVNVWDDFNRFRGTA